MEVSREDQWITPLVQKNLEAGVYEKGPLSPKHENGVYYFHELVRAALAN
jgi:choline monooxygenase